MMFLKSPAILAVCGAMALTACSDTAQLGGNGDHANATSGAAIGAGIGAALGALTGRDGDRTEAALKGAAVGAIIGGVAGNELDKQEADLRQDLGNSDVQITNTGDRLILTMPQDILFATDSSALRSDLQADLRTVAGNLQEYPNSTIQVVGHTDNTGSASYNQQLSNQRAHSVSSVLTSSGVASNRVQAIGRGEDQPVASNLTPEGRAQNRRVEIVILPTAQS